MPSRTETVTVIVPAFNAAATISETIQSILAQRIPGEIAVEIIVVDDASNDDTLSVVGSHVERHPHTIRIIGQAAYAGPAAARNAGLRAATGTLVCFLDADDQYAPGFFGKAAALLADQPRVAAILTDVALIDMHREIHPIQLDDIRKSLPSNVMLRRPVA